MPDSPQGTSPAIAVVGLACWYPGARNPRQLWEQILARRREFRRFPARRFPLADYHDGGSEASDSTYGTRAALIDGFDFDWRGHRIPERTVAATDVVHWLALTVAGQALADAGLVDGDASRTRQATMQRSAVIVGNTLTGEQSRATSLRLRWPFVRRCLTEAADDAAVEVTDTLIEALRRRYMDAFPPPDEDTLAGALSNTIAGRICGHYGLGGGGYTVDGACASSLLAVCHAATALADKDADVALAGGVDVSLDAFELVGFARTGALTAGEMRVYDRRASGFIPGEGCGFVVLQRLENARAAGRTVYAVLRGWGIASDGSSAITAPTVAGQARALRRAYQRAGMDDLAVDFVEGHGTGTSVGDRVELSAIAQVLRTPAPGRHIGVTSLKSIIGHTKAAAGIGAFIKAAIAVNRRVVPPLAGCRQPNPVFDQAAKQLYPVTRGQVRSPRDTLRAGISAMGFGGLNTHVVVESADPPIERLAPRIDERALLSSAWATEIIPLSASSQPRLVELCRRLYRDAPQLSPADAIDLACDLAGREHVGPVRAGLVFSDPADLEGKLATLERLASRPLQSGEIRREGAVFLGHAQSSPRIGFLLPGQGSQHLDMARWLIDRLPWARKLATRTDAWLEAMGLEPVTPRMFRPLERDWSESTRQQWMAELTRTDVAQPAICLAAIVWARFLAKLGVVPVAVAGHSLGELVAFHLAGAFDARAVVELAGVRGRAMAVSSRRAGTMVSLACDAAAARAVIATLSGYATVANINGPGQTVVAVASDTASELAALAERQGIRARVLPVSNAFHSELVADAAHQLEAISPVRGPLAPLSIELYSSLHDGPVRPGLDLAKHFATHVVQPVDFVQMVANLSGRCDILLEVGPGAVLSDLIGTMANAATCLPVASSPEATGDLHSALAALFVRGAGIRWPELCAGRLFRPYVSPSSRQFLPSRCEKGRRDLADRASDSCSGRVISAPAGTQGLQTAMGPTTLDPLHHVRAIVAEFTGFHDTELYPEARLLDDLHLDSIKVARVVGQIALRAGVSDRVDPTAFANATLGEVAEAVSRAARDTSTPDIPSGDEIAVLAVEYVPAPAPSPELWSGRRVRLLADVAHASPLAPRLAAALQQSGARVTAMPFDLPCSGDSGDLIAILPAHTEGHSRAVYRAVQRLHSLARHAPAGPPGRLGLIEPCDGGVESAGAAFVRSLHLERQLPTRIVQLAMPSPMAGDLAESIAGDLAGDSGVAVVRYEPTGARMTECLRPLDLATSPAGTHLDGDDVLLVTGGARGIGAACALALARSSGCRVALLGRTDLNITSRASIEVRRTLDRFAASGLAARYYPADVTRADELERALDCVTRDMGWPTAVVHCAAQNVPRRAERATVAEAVQEVSAKLAGASNLMQQFDVEPPRLFAVFTSLIGVTGLDGNAWYAFANQAVDRCLAQYGHEHGDTRVLSLAFSMWRDVGIAARLGVVGALERRGISAISPPAGAQYFVDLIERDPGVRQPIVTGRLTGRLGGLFAVSLCRLDTRGWRFLDGDMTGLPGRSLTVRTRLTLERDPHLSEHAPGGVPLLPAVLGLEAMAQVAAAIFGQKRPIVEISDVVLAQPIALDHPDGLDIAISGELAPDGTAYCEIRTAATGFDRPHFTARLAFGDRRPSLDNEEFPPGNTVLPPGNTVLIDPMSDLYGSLLFQAGRFRRLTRLIGLRERRVDFEIGAVEQPDNQHWLLGDPFVRDACLQAGQILIPREDALPIRIDRIRFGRGDRGDTRRDGTCILIQTNRRGEVQGRQHEALVILRDSSGNVIERIEGYHLRVVGARPDRPSVDELLAPDQSDRRRLVQRVAELGPEVVLGMLFRPGLHHLDRQSRHEFVRPLLAELAAKKAGISAPITWTASGRPVVEGVPGIGLSVTHDAQYCVAISGSGCQGCDLEPVARRPSHDYEAMLGPRRYAVVQRIMDHGESLDDAATRVWTAGEAGFKAMGSVDVLELDAWTRDRADFIVHANGHRRRVATWPVYLTRGGRRILAVAVPEDAQGRAAASPPGPVEFRDRFVVTFAHCTRADGRVPASQFAAWMGRVRELAIIAVARSVVPMLASGRFGALTNTAEVELVGSATAMDEIEAEITADDASNTSASISLVFSRLADGQPPVPIARARQRFTWVRQSVNGQWQPAPMPHEFASFLASAVAGGSTPALQPGKSLQGRPIDDAPGWCARVATSPDDGNLLGNVYFASYFRWPSRVLRVAEEAFGLDGKLVVEWIRIDYLREARPGDALRVVLVPVWVTAEHVQFSIKFLRDDGHESDIVAAGRARTRWSGTAPGQKIPAALVAALHLEWQGLA